MMCEGREKCVDDVDDDEDADDDRDGRQASNTSLAGKRGERAGLRALGGEPIVGNKKTNK